MFTGIIRNTAKIINLKLLENTNKSLLVIENPFSDNFTIGDSICVNGICLTVVSFDSDTLSFEVLSETLDVTNLKFYSDNNLKVNLELSLKFGDLNHGSEVTGHVDCTCKFIRSEGEKFFFSSDSSISKFVQSKNYIILNGVCLTPVDVNADYFTVCLIPQTLDETNLSDLFENCLVNVEFDKLSKIVVNFLENYNFNQLK